MFPQFFWNKDKTIYKIKILSEKVYNNCIFYKSNLIWRTVSRQVDEAIPLDYPRHMGFCRLKHVVLLLLIVTPTVGFCNCSMFCCALLCVHSSFAIISMGKRELVALLCLPGVSRLLCGASSRCHGFVCSLWLLYFLIIFMAVNRVWHGFLCNNES